MPLSEHEQRVLDEMERNLFSSEADVVTPPESGSLRPNYRGIVVGAIVVALGLGAMVLGVILKQPLIGVLGFIVMAAGVFLAIRPARSSQGTAASGAARASSSSTGRAGKRSSGKLSEKLQERWDKRRSDQ